MIKNKEDYIDRVSVLISQLILSIGVFIILGADDILFLVASILIIEKDFKMRNNKQC